MKTMKSFLLVAAIAFSSVLSASTNSDSAEAKAAEKQFAVVTQTVENLLQNPTFLVEQDMTAKVTVTINKNNEIVVLSVDCEEKSLESYLKSRLNYNELPTAIGNGKKTFVIPVRIEAEI